MKTEFQDIVARHADVEQSVYDDDENFPLAIEFESLDWYDTQELVEMVRLIDAELQNRDLPTAQEQWENEGGGVGVG